MRGWAARLAAVVALVVLVSGCSVGPIRRPAPTKVPSAPSDQQEDVSGAQSPKPPLPPDETRRSRVPVPAGYGQHQIEFTDAAHGYAVFTNCPPGPADGPKADCPAILLVTADGGRSWQPLRHPRPRAKNHQLYAEGSNLVLLAEPYGWWTSTDRGRTFKAAPATADGVPVVYRKLFGRFQVCCDEGTPQVGEWVDDRFRPVPTQPMVPGLNMVAHTGGRLFVSGLRDGQPYAAYSYDLGQTWRSMTVAAPDSPLSVLRLEVAAFDGGAWLIGHGDDRMAFPQLWQLSGGTAWERVRVAGQPAQVGGVAVIGAGMLAVTGPGGSGVIGEGQYHDLGWPLGGGFVRTLSDGTLFSAHKSDGSVWLGIGIYGERRWIRVVLEKQE
ncbi:hypothetical protein GCM10027280_36080 [Micromonospora polyrhachis]|uniref:Uncharacterized protein n=1 Tax=Micromonospora polyrhachis TaxID=1282883 RepID=A0A7W7WQ08_9ACTN|nr:hypothetical protein [Micromonospora polyrhachis]MBB4958788.1 hypothetical protein [Micromonospora polyrhachis]